MSIILYFCENFVIFIVMIKMLQLLAVANRLVLNT